jgi:DNA-binding response OmpR family regulator
MGTKSTLKQAVAAIKSGDKATGKQLLTQVLKADPRNELAWLWMTEAVDTQDEVMMCLRNVLKINPNSQVAKQRLAVLENRQNHVEPPKQEEEQPGGKQSSASASALSLQTPKGEVIIEPDEEEIIINGEAVRISPVELDLLMALTRHQGQVVTYETLLAEVWGITGNKPGHMTAAGIEKYIYFLRRRFEDDPNNPTLICHDEGVGYRLEQI